MPCWRYVREQQHIDAQVCYLVHIMAADPRRISLGYNIFRPLAPSIAHHGDNQCLSKYLEKLTRHPKPTYPHNSLTLTRHPSPTTSLPLPPPLPRTPQPNLPPPLHILRPQSRHRRSRPPPNLQTTLRRINIPPLRLHSLLRRRLGHPPPLAQTPPAAPEELDHGDMVRR